MQLFLSFSGGDATSLVAARKEMGNAAMGNIFGCIAFSSLVINGKASFLGEYPIHYVCFIAVYILTSLNVMPVGV